MSQLATVSSLLRGQRKVTWLGPSDTASRKGDILVTLCRFDDKLPCRSKTGPFIPCERRLADMEILEIQGRDFWRRF